MSYHLIDDLSGCGLYAAHAFRDLHDLVFHGGIHFSQITPKKLEEFFSKQGIFSIACDGHTIVAMAAARPIIFRPNGPEEDAAHALLDNIIVLPDYRKRGIARKLVTDLAVASASKTFHDMKITRMNASCKRYSTDTANFYRSVGLMPSQLRVNDQSIYTMDLPTAV